MDKSWINSVKVWEKLWVNSGQNIYLELLAENFPINLVKLFPNYLALEPQKIFIHDIPKTNSIKYLTK
jgi:hypothetical protein